MMATSFFSHPFFLRDGAVFGQRFIGQLALGCLAFIGLLGFNGSASAQINLSAEPLSPEVAYALSAQLSANPAQVTVRFAIAEGYYMYRDKFSVAQKVGAEKTGSSLTPTFPPSITHRDEFFGDTQIYRQSVDIVYPLTSSVNELTLVVGSQGCADIGICYPPQSQTINLSVGHGWQLWQGGQTDSPLINNPFARTPQQSLQSSAINPPTNSQTPANPTATESRTEEQSDSEKIATNINERGFWLSLLVFLGIGVALSLTPCNLPMVPILGALITGQLHKKKGDFVHPHQEDFHRPPSSAWRGLRLSAGFVLGMALTYAVFGALAGLSGQWLSSALQTPAVRMVSALIMVVLALASFGAYSMQMPNAWQLALRKLTDQLPQNSFWALVAVGAVSALIVGPCVAAPLAGLLLYISTQGSVFEGALLLFVLAWGQGLPLLAFGAFADRFLPKMGAWMQSINRLLGFLLIAVAIWFVAPLQSITVQMMLWGSFLLVGAVFLHALDGLPDHAHPIRRLGKALGWLGLILGIALWVGALSGGKNLYKPLEHLSAGASIANAPTPQWVQVNSPDDWHKILNRAGDKKILLDFYADWCVTCVEMEHLTFSQAQVAQAMSNFVLVRADVTANRPEHLALMKQMGVFGPPAILFFESGQEQKAKRLIGFEPAEAFHARLTRIK